MNDNEKALNLIRFLKDYSACNKKIPHNKEDNKKNFDIGNLIENREYVMYFQWINESEIDDIVLKLKQPKHDSCPCHPDERILECIKFKYEDFEVEPVVDTDALVRYNIEKEYDRFIQEREKWVSEQKKKKEINKIFDDLYKWSIDLANESEEIELMCGNAIIRTADDKRINYPILLQKLSLEYDSESESMIMRKVKDPEVNTTFLNEIDSENDELNQLIDSDKLYALNEYEKEKLIEPLDRDGIIEFIDKAKTLNYKSETYTDESDFNESYFKYRNVRLAIICKPVIFVRKRMTGIIETYKNIISNIQDGGEIPKTIGQLTGEISTRENVEEDEKSFEEKLAECCGEDKDIILPLPANREQLRIARRINLYDNVLVQGPPGTGKTHTIANLICNFLANGESVLVTSSTKKALTVLKDKVPPELQAMCISLLDDDKKDVERAVNGIMEYSGHNTAQELREKAEKYKDERNQIIDELYQVRGEIFKCKHKDVEEILCAGRTSSPIDIAKKYDSNRSRYDGIIPGNVERSDEMPLDYKELSELYELNNQFSELEDHEFKVGLPDIARIPRVEEVEELISSEQKIKENFNYNKEFSKYIIGSFSIESGEIDLQNFRELEKKLDEVSYIDAEWKKTIISSIIDNSAAKEAWLELVDVIEKIKLYKGENYKELVIHKVNIDIESYDVIKQNLEKSVSANNSGANIFKKFNRGKADSYLEENVLIDDEKMNPKSSDDCSLLEKKLKYIDLQSKLKTLWNGLFSHGEIQEFNNSDEKEPEEIASKYVNGFKKCIDWHDDEYIEILQLIEKSGFDYSGLLDELTYPTGREQLDKILDFFTGDLYNFIRFIVIENETNKIKCQLNKFPQESKLCKDLRLAYEDRKSDEYRSIYEVIMNLNEKTIDAERRSKLLNRLGEYAPEWKSAVLNHKGIHGKTSVPDNIDKAWEWKQQGLIIKEFADSRLEELQDKSVELSRQYRKISKEYASALAWSNLLKRLEANIDMKRNLESWNQAIHKIGKGHGKNAAKFKKIARDKISACQDAVPVWIMTVNQIYDNLTPGKNIFDVVIVDEASQCDITALAIAFFAKKVIIVGDDKQVSPSSIGVQIDAVNKMQDMYLKNIPDYQILYTSKQSLYDIASTIAEKVMLREHFRCVPDIIGFSNMISYENKIKPLRSSFNTNLEPAMVPLYIEEGRRDPDKKINKVEAQTAASLIEAMVKMPEYKDKTIGVITMLGIEQADLILKEVSKLSGIAAINKHSINFGNSANFQGDERDVIILSLVDSNQSEKNGEIKPLKLSADDDMQKRYNVAVSRAKEQIFILHSMDVDDGLKPGDLRKRLLEYAYAPNKFRDDESIESSSDSPFETEVCKRLRNHNYSFKQQYEVGAYKLDIVVNGKNKQIAIECDGEAYHSGKDKIIEDLERQTILERLGWTFIRIRGCEFYADKDKTMNFVFEKLKEYDVLPSAESVEKSSEFSETRNCVVKKAEEIMQEEYGIDIPQKDKKDIVDDYAADINEDIYIRSMGVESDNHKNDNFIDTTSTKEDDGIVTSNINESIDEGPAFCDEVESDNIIDLSIESKYDEEKNLNKSDKSLIDDSDIFDKECQEYQKECIENEPEILQNSEDLLDKLYSSGFKCFDHREKADIIWVIYKKNKKDDFENILSKFDYSWKLEKRGVVATSGNPAWRIMIRR